MAAQSSVVGINSALGFPSLPALEMVTQDKDQGSVSGVLDEGTAVLAQSSRVIQGMHGKIEC
jgi:hypothetical protein